MRAFGRRRAATSRVAATHPGTAGSPARASLRLGTTPFAVIDVETTGFSPRLHDRVVELAVLRLSPDGGLEDEYATLTMRSSNDPTSTDALAGERAMSR